MWPNVKMLQALQEVATGIRTFPNELLMSNSQSKSLKLYQQGKIS